MITYILAMAAYTAAIVLLAVVVDWVERRRR